MRFERENFTLSFPILTLNPSPFLKIIPVLIFSRKGEGLYLPLPKRAYTEPKSISQLIKHYALPFSFD